MSRSAYTDYILDILSPLGEVTARAMFGGYGIYRSGIIFGIVVEETLYFKVDDSNRAEFEAQSSAPFSYETKGGKRVAMSYWHVPAEVLEESDSLILWAKKAYDASCNAVKPRRKTGKKKHA